MLVRHVVAGPFEGLAKEDLPAQLCAFTPGVLRAEARSAPGWYDLVHSHYWLSGQVGWLAKDRWGVPLVHTAHTLAKVKNALLADGDRPEPRARVIGEEQVVAEADRLVANTADRGRGPRRPGTAPARPGRQWCSPGWTWSGSGPPPWPRGEAVAAARRRLGLPEDGYAGRVRRADPAAQGARRAAAGRRRSCARATRSSARQVHGGDRRRPERQRAGPADRADRAGRRSLGIADRVRFLPPQPRDRAGRRSTAPPTWSRCRSYNESFGLVALEAQACGTPVVAAAVGGLVTAVRDGVSGVLVDGHDPADWARVIGGLLAAPGRRARLARGAVAARRRLLLGPDRRAACSPSTVRRWRSTGPGSRPTWSRGERRPAMGTGGRRSGR